MNNGKYLYCFIDGKVTEPIDLTGIGGYGKVYFLDFKNITAALSDTPLMVFDPSRENAMAHEKVIQQLMTRYSLVPCNFGNVFKSKEDVLTFLDKAYKQIYQNIEKVRGKIEMGLRVFWKKEIFGQEIETKEIIELRDEIMKTPNSGNYLSKIELGKKVEEQVNSRRQFYIHNIYDQIARYAENAVINDPSNPIMILNSAFLIPKIKEQEFDRIVESVLKKYSDNLEFSYSGPWPPYNFTSIDAT